MRDADARRDEMVRRQVERRGVRDPRVLQAMRETPREHFVSPALRTRAFEDRALPIDRYATDTTWTEGFAHLL